MYTNKVNLFEQHRAFRSYNSFREDSSFFIWIYRITLNVANDYIKKKEKMPVQSLEDAGYTIDDIIDHDQTNPLDVAFYPHTNKVGLFTKDGSQNSLNKIQVYLIMRENDFLKSH